MRADLHTHTNFSDGSCTPKQLLEKAKEADIQVLAVTDHDNIAGVRQTIELSSEYGIKVISGVELSSFSSFEVHILGYNFDPDSDVLNTELERLLGERRKRMKEILFRLAKYNIHLDEAELQMNCVGRMHIASLLKKGGYVSSINEAFDRYLSVNRPAYVESSRLSPLSAVKLIGEAGGMSVVAHPLNFLNRNVLEPLLAGLKNYGLGGLEVYYPSHKPSDIEKLKIIAKKYGLTATGGSDFHGEDGTTTLGSGGYEPNYYEQKALKINPVLQR